tara:strand:+ start:1074 stop:3275 length:2202 start_codon:yes stop_codon:yes gene_type:complete
MRKELALYVRNIYGLDSAELENPAIRPFERVEFFKDETVTLTQTIKNSTVPDKLFTDFTQGFTIPASPVNNKIFKHYYNNGILGFDARIKVPARLELNLMPFKDGYIKLESVAMEFGKPISYKITFFGNTVGLTELFGEDQLSNLDWLNNFSLLYDGAEIKNTFSTNNNNVTVDGVQYVDPIITPLITHTRRLYYNSTQTVVAGDGNLSFDSTELKGVRATDLKYAIRNEVIIKAIEKTYPTISFGSSTTRFFRNNNASFYNMYMWLSRRKGSVQADSAFEAPVYPFFVPFNTISSTDVAFGSVDPVTGITVNIPSQYNSFDGSVSCSINVAAGSNSVIYNYELSYNGLAVSSALNVTNDQNVVIPNNLQNVTSGTFTLIISPQTTLVLTQVSLTLERAYVNDSGADIEESSQFSTGSFTITAAFNFEITQQIPQMQILDYLTNLFKMFNLIAYVTYDPSTGISTIEVQDYNQYYFGNSDYDLGYKSIDITKYVAVDKETIATALPYGEINLSYKDLKTFFASFHKQITNQNWGTETYRGADNTLFSGDTYKVEIGFEHQKYERLIDGTGQTVKTIQWGWSVDDNEESYIGNPLQFYAYRKTGGTELSFMINDSTVESLTNYWLPANSIITGNATAGQSLNFFPETDEWTFQVNLNTLFKNYYEIYMEGIFDFAKRIITVEAYLPDSVLNDLQLNDRFIIGDNTYVINSITTNFATGKSTLELLTENLKQILL